MSGKIQSKMFVEPGTILDILKKEVDNGFSHLVTVTAVDLKESIELIYHLSDLKGNIKHVSTRIPRDKPEIATITTFIPGADFYEREITDLFGISFYGKQTTTGRFILPECYPPGSPPPLLKNVDSNQVKDTLGKQETCEFKATTLHAPLSPESVVVPVGPYHPAFKEPEYFSLVTDGERIVKAFLRIGFVHRGIEKAAETRSYLRDIFLLERVCGICSASHSWCFVEAVEKLLGVEPPSRATYLRTIVAELERIHSHSLWLGLVGYWIGFESMFMWVWGIREEIMNLMEEISGNRVHKSFVTIGGVRRDVSDSLLRKIQEITKEFGKQFENLLDTLVSSEEVIERTKGIGKYDIKVARKFCTVGPVRRAAGELFDVRKLEPYGAYTEVDFEVPTEEEGDVYSLIKIRVKEVLESINIIHQLIEKMPSGNPVPSRYFMGTVPEGEAYGRIEAPRGELFYYVKANNTHNPYRVKIRTPTLANIQLVANILEGYSISDFPVIVTSIDPCFSCMDRVTVINSSTGEKTVLPVKLLKEKRRR